MEAIRILGTGSYVPPRVLTNQGLQAMGLDTSDEWIASRTGVRERRIAAADIATSDLACEAARRALEMAGITAAELDLIIVATITPDTCCPSAANWLQFKLNAPRAVTFDVTAACSGFVFGLNVAEQYLKSGSCRFILVAAAEVMSRTLNWTDRSSCILWGDGAGAAVLARGSEGAQLLATHLHTDGSRGQDLLLPGGGSTTTPIGHDSVERGLHTLRLVEGNLSFRVAVRGFIDAIRECSHANGVGVEEIAWFIPHQANQRMFENIAGTLKIPFERFYLTLPRYGNMSSASCAVSLDDAVRDGSVKRGDLVCLPVFGGGLTWGSALIRW